MAPRGSARKAWTEAWWPARAWNSCPPGSQPVRRAHRIGGARALLDLGEIRGDTGDTNRNGEHLVGQPVGRVGPVRPPDTSRFDPVDGIAGEQGLHGVAHPEQRLVVLPVGRRGDTNHRVGDLRILGDIDEVAGRASSVAPAIA